MSENNEAIKKSANDSDSSPYISINIVEDLVKSAAPEYAEKMGCCTCYRCVNDIIAMTLNALPPKYVVTQKGMLFSKISSYENQHSADLMAALTKSCLFVKESPRH